MISIPSALCCPCPMNLIRTVSFHGWCIPGVKSTPLYVTIEQKKKLIDFIKEHDIHPIGIVLSMSHELDTDGVISWMVQSGREVYTPVCDYREKEMNFSRFSSFDDVVTDEKNLRVPSDQSDV